MKNVDSTGTKGASLEDNFLFYVFAAFSITKMERKATNRHVFLRMVREVEMSRDWFRSVFIVNLNIPKVFAETITQSAADVYFFA